MLRFLNLQQHLAKLFTALFSLILLKINASKADSLINDFARH
jgi:hypothetical protein